MVGKFRPPAQLAPTWLDVFLAEDAPYVSNAPRPLPLSP